MPEELVMFTRTDKPAVTWKQLILKQGESI